jgi:hypothetical protein
MHAAEMLLPAGSRYGIQRIEKPVSEADKAYFTGLWEWAKENSEEYWKGIEHGDLFFRYPGS